MRVILHFSCLRKALNFLVIVPQIIPEPSIVLEYAVEEQDISEGGDGLESHPKPTTGTLYISIEIATTIKRTRDDSHLHLQCSCFYIVSAHVITIPTIAVEAACTQ